MIESGSATLRELREYYSLEDLYNMWEIVYTAKYNKWKSIERARQSAELRHKRRRT